MRYDPQKHISGVEFHGGSNGGLKIQLGPQNPAVIRDNSCQIEIFGKIMKNVFYAEFHGESNGAIHFRLRRRNLSKMQKIDLSIRSGSFFDVSWIAESDFRNSFRITESAMKF